MECAVPAAGGASVVAAAATRRARRAEGAAAAAPRKACLLPAAARPGLRPAAHTQQGGAREQRLREQREADRVPDWWRG